METLENLKILELLWDSFMGKKLVCSSEGFLQLKSLLLYDLTNFEEWELEKGVMPNLSILMIRNCTMLKMVQKV